MKNSLLSFASLALIAFSSQGQSFVLTNYTFDTTASASPPSWGAWPNGAGNYVTNGWSAADAGNNPASGSLLITTAFTGSNQQSIVWSGPAGDYTPPLNGALLTNFSCAIRFDPASPTNAATRSFGSIAFYLNTVPRGANPLTHIGSYYSIANTNTNWVFFSIPVSTASSVYGVSIQLETYYNTLVGTSKMYVDNIQLTGGTNPPVNGASTVDWNNVHQRIDGFGASSAWNSSWNTAEADLLFSTNNNITYKSATYNGVGLSLLRNHITYASSTAASDSPTTSEATIMQWAQTRGARVWSAPWTPAAGFKGANDLYDTNHSYGSGIDGGSYLGSGNNVTNVNYASQLANYVVNMKNIGVSLYALSIQNEPDANVTNYEACQWSASQIHDFVTNLHAALVAKGVGATKIIIPESQSWSSGPGLYNPTLTDPTTAAAVDIIANHNYAFDNNVGDQSPPQALATSGKTLWETEVALLTGSDSSIANGVYYARRIHQFMTQAQANAYHYWWLVASGQGNEGLLDTSAAPTKRLFAFGQYSRFVRPNFNRIDATASQSSALVSAYKDSTSTAFAIVTVNTNVATDVIETFNLSHFTAASVTPWITSSALSLAPQAPILVANGSFTYTLPALSVVTFAGNGNTRPVMGSVSDQTATAGATLLVTNTATDSDLPPQTLTFSPARPLPAGATLNADSGVLSWRPPVSQANTTNAIQIQVTDSGSPNLSATDTFNVVVKPVANPAFGSVNLTGGQVSMTVSGPQGPDYSLLASSNLVNWQTLITTNSPPTPFTLIDTNSSNSTRFYRIQIGP